MQSPIPFNQNVIFSDPRVVARKTRSAFGTGFLTLPLQLTPVRALSIAILHDCLVCDKPPLDEFDSYALAAIRRMISDRIPFSGVADALGHAESYQVRGDGKHSAANLTTYCRYLSTTSANLTYWEEFLSLECKNYTAYAHYHPVLYNSLYS